MIASATLLKPKDLGAGLIWKDVKEKKKKGKASIKSS